MTTLTLAPATPAPPPQVDLETRLAIADAAMTVRLAEAAAQFAIRTAHIDIDPLPDTADTISTLPLFPTLVPAAAPYGTPIASLLHRARAYIETHGWLQGGLREDDGPRRCPIGAIRIEADGNRHLADDACTLLLEAIQNDHPHAETIPSWNDTQTTVEPVLNAFDRAIQLADSRQL